MSDLELLKVYLQEQIDITGNKRFVFEECNAIEFRLTDAINEINELQKELCQKENVIKNIKNLAEDLLDSYAKDEGEAILEIIEEDLKGNDKK